MERIVIIVAIIASLVSMAAATPGNATPFIPTACFDLQPESVMLAAGNKTLWAGWAVCGKMFRVRSTGSGSSATNPCTSKMVTMVDLCPECHSTMTISKEAFTQTSTNPDAGVVNIDYTPISVLWITRSRCHGCGRRRCAVEQRGYTWENVQNYLHGPNELVDRCPSPGCQASMDLSQEASSQIADGKINIEYNQA